MTNFRPELVAAAKRMYEAFDSNVFTVDPKPWKDLSEDLRNYCCQAFAAGLEALLPVSDEIKAVMEAEKPYVRDELTAAIRYLTQTGGKAVTRRMG